MDYINENGRLYKITDKETGSVISFGELTKGELLSTIHIVDFIDKLEYLDLKGNESHEQP